MCSDWTSWLTQIRTVPRVSMTFLKPPKLMIAAPSKLIPVRRLIVCAISCAPPSQPPPLRAPAWNAALILSVPPVKPLFGNAGICASVSRGMEIRYAWSCVAGMCRMMMLSERTSSAAQRSRASTPSSSMSIGPSRLAPPSASDLPASPSRLRWAMPPVACPITTLLPTMAAPLLSISTAPNTTVSRAQRGSLRLVRFFADPPPPAPPPPELPPSPPPGGRPPGPPPEGRDCTGMAAEIRPLGAADPEEEGRRLA
jgi:hypothetical protein